MEITDELKVLVTAEVERAVSNMKQLDKQTKSTSDLFKTLGKSISAAWAIKSLVKFTAQSVSAYNSQKQVLAVLSSTVKATGANAWTSAEQLNSMADSLEKVTNFDGKSIMQMQSVLLGFKNISGENFEQATKAILDMAQVMGTDLKSAAQSVGKALDDPVNGMDSLKKQGFNFSAAQKKVIQDMLETNNVAGAQKIILDELAGTFGGAAQAAADSGTQIKNAWGKVLEGVGKFISDLGNEFDGSKLSNLVKDSLLFLADSFDNGVQNTKRLIALKTDSYNEFYEKLSDTEKLEEATLQLENWQKEYKKALETGNTEKIDNSIVNIDAWRHEVALLKEAAYQEQQLQKAANERREAENAINDLMYSINGEYDKMAKQDPAKQLISFNQELEKIAKNRAELLSTTTGIDTSQALKQLDYLEKQIKIKIKSLSIYGKKSWQSWLSELTGVDINTFDTGKEAGQQFIDGIRAKTQGKQLTAQSLGIKFSLSDSLKEEKEQIQEVLLSLFSIDPSKIDESFTSTDGVVQLLIDRWKNLDEQIKNTHDGFDSWEEMFTTGIENVLEKFSELDKESASVLSNLGTNLASISFDATLSGLESFGQALGEGKDAGESLSQALADMAQQILNQLPTMFLQAGLQLIAQGQWAMGLGFITAAGATAVTSGFVNGRTSDSSTQANADGGIYSQSGRVAFANGGVFTNSIVDRPTTFRFANGGGFGNGLMGEAGPEAIMPLKRGADGSLGVAVNGTENVKSESESVIVNVYANDSVETKESTGSDGRKVVDIIVGSMKSAINSGSFDKTFSSRFGLKVRGV